MRATQSTLVLLAAMKIDAFQIMPRIKMNQINSIPPKSLQRFFLNPSSRSPLNSIHLSQTTTSSEDPEGSKCPVTQLGCRVTKILGRADKYFLNRFIRISNHVPALLSLSYFGLISMASMMSMGPMAAGCDATLQNVLTKTVGATTNAEFAALFPPSSSLLRALCFWYGL